MKKVLISILTLIFIISMANIVNASTASITLGASSDTVIKGKTFTVTLAGVADNDITGLESKLSYDTTKLSIESKTAGSNFSDLSGSSSIDIASTGSTLSKSATLYTITFKVLDNAAEGDTTISVTDATIAIVNEASTQENIQVSNASATITIKSDDTTAGSSNNTSKDDNSTSVNTTNTKKTTTKLPQTGIEMVSIIAIVALGVISIVSYVSYKKYKNI